MIFNKSTLILLIIVILAIFLRFEKLGTIPIGFNDDEAAFGYNAYSILKTGRDEWGRILPFPTFESFGDWKLVGYLYPTVASQFIFGVNEFATRFPSALFGLGSVFTTYLLTKKLFDKKVALLSSLLIAINPWHILASRNAFESDVLIFFITLGTYLFLKGSEKKKFFPFSFIFFALSFYIYRSAWVFLPLFIYALYLSQKKLIHKEKVFFLKNLIFFAILLLPLIPTVVSFQGQSRFFQESFIFGVQKSGIINEINEKRGACLQESYGILCKLIYNKYSSFISTYFNNYFENLSPQTLFTKGPAQGYQSFSNRGLMYSFELPLFILGIILLLVTKNQNAKILIPWLLIVPIGASFTGVGNPGRLNIFLPIFQIIEAFAIVVMIQTLKQPILRKSFITIFILVTAFSFSKLLTDMFYHYPKISGRYQRYGYKQLFNYLESEKYKYDQIAVSRKNDDAKQYIHYLFFEKMDPNLFFDPNYTIKYRGKDKWQEVEKIGKFRFYQSTLNLVELPSKSLLAVGEKELFIKSEPIFEVLYPNGDKVFEVYNVEGIKEDIKNSNPFNSYEE